MYYLYDDNHDSGAYTSLHTYYVQCHSAMPVHKVSIMGKTMVWVDHNHLSRLNSSSVKMSESIVLVSCAVCVPNFSKSDWTRIRKNAPYVQCLPSRPAAMPFHAFPCASEGFYASREEEEEEEEEGEGGEFTALHLTSKKGVRTGTARDGTPDVADQPVKTTRQQAERISCGLQFLSAYGS